MTGVRGALTRLLREPLVHFAAIGVAVFALHAAVSAPASRPAEVIEVTEADLDRLAAQFEAVWRRPPTGKETTSLVREFVKDEVYFREALALGLDRNDTMVRRLMRQKMEFLGDSAAGLTGPDDATLAAWLADNAERFARPPSLSFRHVFLGDATDREIASARAALESGASAETLGWRTLLPVAMVDAAPSLVDRTFGDDFFTRVAALPSGQWSGPVASSFGRRLVLVEASEPGGPPELDAIRAAVEQGWRRDDAVRLREVPYEALRARYRVVLPKGS